MGSSPQASTCWYRTWFHELRLKGSLGSDVEEELRSSILGGLGILIPKYVGSLYLGVNHKCELVTWGSHDSKCGRKLTWLGQQWHVGLNK